MGARGARSKFTAMGLPGSFDLDWDAIEAIHGAALSSDDRDGIVYSLKFYSSSKGAEKLPMRALQDYEKKLRIAYNALEKLPASAKHSLRFDELRGLLFVATGFAQSQPDESANCWDSLIIQLSYALGYVTSGLPKTTLTDSSAGLPPKYLCLREILKQADIREHFITDDAFAKAVARVVEKFDHVYE